MNYVVTSRGMSRPRLPGVLGGLPDDRGREPHAQRVPGRGRERGDAFRTDLFATLSESLFSGRPSDKR